MAPYHLFLLVLLSAVQQALSLANPRAVPNSPSNSYAPAAVPCPATRPTIRSAASGLSPNETAFLAQRRPAALSAMTEFISRANISDFDATTYLNNNNTQPTIAIAMSGGGYRALMNGAGFLAAADNRTTTNGIGGLLQATTYMAGLSGAAWLVGSMYGNNFSTVQQLRDSGTVWQFQNSIFTGPSTQPSGNPGVLSTVSYWTDIRDQVDDKSSAGFNTSVTDYWGRALSYQLIDDSDAGAAYTWSSFALSADLIAGRIPMPLVVADSRDPNVRLVSLNATNFEIGPWEMGSWDPTVFGFAPTRYVGSNFSAGAVPSSGQCVEGFDQLGYVMGTSSSLFNEFLTANISQYADIPSFIGDALSALLNTLGDDSNDIAQWQPNPFFGFNPSTNPTTNSAQLSLVDGGEDLQNIPFNPLLQPQRQVDVIFAIDSSADTSTNWPNGTALRATYERSKAAIANGTSFPAIPDANTFINLGLNNRPTFFGCDASNFSSSDTTTPPPLVVYIPNAPYTTTSNVTTFDPSYPINQRNDIITNGFNAASQANGTLDAEWPACVACAALSRGLARSGTDVPAQCSDCFDRYCWNGTLSSARPAGGGAYEPVLKVGNQSTSSSGDSGGSGGGGTSSGGGGGGDNSNAGARLGANWIGVMVVVGLVSVGGVLF